MNLKGSADMTEISSVQHPSTIALILLGLAILIGSQFGENSAGGSTDPLLVSVEVGAKEPSSDVIITLDGSTPASADLFADSASAPDSDSGPHSSNTN
jgi:hypothetical protein